MFESPAAALALLLGLIAIGLNLAVGLNLRRFLTTVAIVVFSVYQIHCADVGDCEVLAFVYCAIPLALVVYFCYLFFNPENAKKNKEKKN